ncbi:MAG TPA: hypothetical protein VHY91_17030 [Pirellulales bacterium]|nr:hypothetical protein [Pirellulales bacterium]
MAEGFSSDLVFEAGVVALLALLIAWHDMPLILAVPAVLLRVGLTMFYFAEFFDGTWCLIDDLIYFNDSSTMLRDGFNPLTVLITPDGADALANAAGGRHFLYQWWSLSAMYLFGEHYYAAVLLNVLSTFVGGFLLNRITTLLGFSRGYRIGLELFYLLHWDVITWSSFINLKESLVQLLTICGMYCMVRFCQLRDWLSVVGFILVVQLFYWIRFYLPVLMLFSAVLWVLWQWSDPRKFVLVAIAGGVILVGLQGVGGATEFIEYRQFPYGFSVILLAPLPWVQFEDVFWFIGIPAVFHLALILPAGYGAWQLWKTNGVARLFVIYAGVLLCFYGLVEFDGFRGPRQRSQLAFVFAWIQFHFLWSMRPAAIVKAVPASHLNFRPSPVSRRPLVTVNPV